MPSRTGQPGLGPRLKPGGSRQGRACPADSGLGHGPGAAPGLVRGESWAVPGRARHSTCAGAAAVPAPWPPRKGRVAVWRHADGSPAARACGPAARTAPANPPSGRRPFHAVPGARHAAERARVLFAEPPHPGPGVGPFVRGARLDVYDGPAAAVSHGVHWRPRTPHRPERRRSLPAPSHLGYGGSPARPGVTRGAHALPSGACTRRVLARPCAPCLLRLPGLRYPACCRSMGPSDRPAPIWVGILRTALMDPADQTHMIAIPGRLRPASRHMANT